MIKEKKKNFMSAEEAAIALRVIARLEERQGKKHVFPGVSALMVRMLKATLIDYDEWGEGVSIPAYCDEHGLQTSPVYHAFRELPGALTAHCGDLGIRMMQRIKDDHKGRGVRHLYTIEFIEPCPCCGGCGRVFEKEAGQ